MSHHEQWTLAVYVRELYDEIKNYDKNIKGAEG